MKDKSDLSPLYKEASTHIASYDAHQLSSRGGLDERPPRVHRRIIAADINVAQATIVAGEGDATQENRFVVCPVDDRQV
jgi:hypothetical protein